MASNLNLEMISGEIENTLSGSTLTSGDLTKVQQLKQWFNEKRSHMKPWAEFLNMKKLSTPQHVGEATRRIVTNVKVYQANYVFVCLLLAVYCVLTSPLLLFGLAVSIGGCSYIRARGAGQSIQLFGRTFAVGEQYGLVFMISLPLFFLASAGSTVFWIIGASIFVIMVHASLLSIEAADPEMQMDSIQVK